MLDALGAATKVIYPSEGYHTEDVAEGAKIERSNIKVVALAEPTRSCWRSRRSTT